MDFKKIQTGEFLSTTMYLEVLSKNDKDGSIEVKDSFGRTFTIKGKQLIEQTMTSANQFDKEDKVTRTKAAEVLSSVGDKAFTVTFNKADGTERVLTGRMLESETLMGRAQVFDLALPDGPKGRNQRQVDYRELKSVVLNGTKFTVKK